MTKCDECGNVFSVSEARSAYNSANAGDGLDYDEYHGGGRCFDCATSEDEANLNHGRAVLMMANEEEYDAEHVEKYL